MILAPIADASGHMVGWLDVETVSAGQADLFTSDWLVDVHRGEDGGHMPFLLEASWVTVVLDRSETKIDSGSNLFYNYSSKLVHEGPATIRSTALGPSFTYVVNATGAHGTLAGDTVRISDPDHEHFTMRSSPASERRFDPVSLESYMDVAGDGVKVSLAGPMFMKAFGLEVSLLTAEGEETIWTGYRNEPLGDPANPVPYGGRTAYQELFLIVSEGTLWFTLDKGVTRLYTRNGTMQSEGDVEAAGVAGTITFEGPVTMDIAGDAEGAVKARVAEDGEEPNQGPGTLPQPAPSEPPPSPTSVASDPARPWTAVWWSSAIASVAILGIMLRQVVWMRIVRATDIGDFGYVSKRAWTYQWSPRRRQAITFQALALIEQQQWQGAARLLDRRGRVIPAAMQDFLRARVAAAQGQVVVARRRLQACLSKDASFQIDIESDPALAPLLSHGPGEGYA